MKEQLYRYNRETLGFVPDNSSWDMKYTIYTSIFFLVVGLSIGAICGNIFKKPSIKQYNLIYKDDTTQVYSKDSIDYNKYDTLNFE